MDPLTSLDVGDGFTGSVAIAFMNLYANEFPRQAKRQPSGAALFRSSSIVPLKFGPAGQPLISSQDPGEPRHLFLQFGGRLHRQGDFLSKDFGEAVAHAKNLNAQGSLTGVKPL